MEKILLTIAIALTFSLLAYCLYSLNRKRQLEITEHWPDETPEHLKRTPKTDTDVENYCNLCENKEQCPSVGHSENCGRDKV